jgi:hypothetical protein
MTSAPPENSRALIALENTPPAPSAFEFADPAAYQQTVRGRLSVFPLALSLMLLGLVLVAQNYVTGLEVSLVVVTLTLGTGLILSFLFRFFASGRRERGLLFLALSAMVLMALLGLMSLLSQTFPAHQAYPLLLVGLGLSVWLTYLLGRDRDRGLLGLGALFIFMGGVGVAVTYEILSPRLTQTVGDYAPLLLAVAGITLIPLALRRPKS